MMYAPIIIPTLCRYEHFHNCIESLKKNAWASKTELFIALDYPANDSHFEGYMKICSYLESSDMSAFKKITIIKREKNYGAFDNENELVEKYIVPFYDCWCRMDDDVVCSPNFIEYIDKGLTAFKDDRTVFAVSGYSYPCDYYATSGANVLLENFYLSMWGTAFWTDKYLAVRKRVVDEKYMHWHLMDNLKSKKYKNLMKSRFIDFVDAGLSWNREKLAYRMSDVGLTMYIGLNDLYVVYPLISKCKNNGFDGSGNTCPEIKDNIYASQQIDESRTFELKVSSEKYAKENLRQVNLVDAKPKVQLLRSWLKILLYKIVGCKLYKKLWFSKNRNKYSEFTE